MEIFCKNCNHELDASTGVTCERERRPGDVSICFYCGQVCLFLEDLTLRKVRDEEMEEIKLKSPETYCQIVMISEAIKRKIILN